MPVAHLQQCIFGQFLTTGKLILIAIGSVKMMLNPVQILEGIFAKMQQNNSVYFAKNRQKNDIKFFCIL
jgi:hypothetical protein